MGTCRCCESHTCTQRLVGSDLRWAHPSHSTLSLQVARGQLQLSQSRPAITRAAAWATAARLSHWLMSPQTTYKGKSSFQTYSDYLRWESFLQQQLKTLPEGSALHRGFQTCEHWKRIFMEIIGKRQPSPPPTGSRWGGWWRQGHGEVT